MLQEHELEQVKTLIAVYKSEGKDTTLLEKRKEELEKEINEYTRKMNLFKVSFASFLIIFQLIGIMIACCYC